MLFSLSSIPISFFIVFIFLKKQILITMDLSFLCVRKNRFFKTFSFLQKLLFLFICISFFLSSNFHFFAIKNTTLFFWPFFNVYYFFNTYFFLPFPSFLPFHFIRSLFQRCVSTKKVSESAQFFFGVFDFGAFFYYFCFCWWCWKEYIQSIFCVKRGGRRE